VCRRLRMRSVAAVVLTAPVPVNASPTTSPCATAVVTLRGTGGNDRIVGTAGNDVIEAGNGDDIVDVSLGGNGNDTLIGGAGDDVLCGGDGRDRLLPGAGTDQAYGENDDDLISGGCVPMRHCGVR
jgi:Ca2+-binding RTX toxin-like protein